MTKYDDEFKDVKKRLPSDKTTQKASINLVVLYTVVGLILGAVVLLFQDTITSEGRRLSQYGYVPAQVILNGILSLLAGSIQAWLFKSKIKSRTYVFIAFSFLGGIIGGLAGGFLMNSGLLSSIIIGAVSGFLAGGISSFSQNNLMGNIKYKSQWFLYNTISWAVIFSITWTIGWQRESFPQIALAAAFFMIASGVGLVVFLNKIPQIEFS